MDKDVTTTTHSLSLLREYHQFMSVQVEQEGPQTSLRDLLTVLFKHKWKITAIFAATLAAVATGTFLIPPVYEAESTLLIKFGREFTYRPEVTDKAPAVSINQEEAINSEINIITSRDLTERVIQTLQLKKMYPELLANPSAEVPPLDAAVKKFGKNLKVEVLKKTNVLQVRFQHHDPKIAARAVNLLVDFYKERHFEVYNGPESEFLAKQLAAYQRQLKDSEDTMQDFKQQHMVYSLDEQRGLLLKQRTDLDASLKAVVSQIGGLKEKTVALQAQMKELSKKDSRYTQTDRDRIIVEAKAQLLNLQLKEHDLLNRYPERNQFVVNVRNEIAMVKEFLKEQEEDISGKVKTSNSVYQKTEQEAILTGAELKSALAQERSLRQQLAQMDAAVRAIDRNEKPLQNLARQISTNDKNYRYYLDRLEEARISSDMNRQKLANLSVIQPATVPSLPIKPNKLVNLVLGLILGAVSGLGCAMISEYTSQGLSGPEDAQRRLQLPVLATVVLKEQSLLTVRQSRAAAEN